MLRRDFLKRAVQAGTIIPIASSGLFARPLEQLLSLSGSSGLGDRVLVLINLNGGNDGLNTVVPVDEAKYYSARPTIALKKNETLPIATGLGLHNVMTAIQGMYNDGDCAIVQSVGYPEQDRSHFRSTDIWHSGSPADAVWQTGWLGRYLAGIHPDYPGKLPDAPFAMQIGTSASLALYSDVGGMGMAIDNPDRFYNLANGLGVTPTPVPNTLAGPELRYVRDVIEQSNVYSGKIYDAVVGAPNNPVTYEANSLAQQLKIVARLINGGLSTNIFIVSLGGFDTHIGQGPAHAQLLSAVSRGVRAFLDDITMANNADRVVCMTYSEFGRRVNENGSVGTDHGAAAPQFLMGRPVKGGQVIGGVPDLVNLDNRGDIKYKVDFRQIYATVLQDWLGFPPASVDGVMGGTFNRLPLFDTPAFGVPDEEHARMAGYALAQNTPNPAGATTTIEFTVPKAARVHIGLFGTGGRKVATVVDRSVEAGRHRVAFDAASLPSGTYVYRLEADGFAISRRMIVTH